MRAPPAKPPYTARPGEAVRVSREADGDFLVGIGRIAVAPDDVEHVDAVVADLGRLVHMLVGEAALRDGDAIGRRVRIVKPDPPTDPPNAWVVPDNPAAAAATGVALGRGPDGAVRHGTGTGCGSTIVYDPADWPLPGDPGSPSSIDVLLTLLRQANMNARGASDPGKPDWGVDEAAPRTTGREPREPEAARYIPAGQQPWGDRP
jgi:hypothetical protein